jgi:hypothetical protein
MKTDWEDGYEIPASIDLSKGNWIKNPYVQRFEELNLVSLDDDLRAAFPDSLCVNQALRRLLKIEEKSKAGQTAKAA